VRRRAAAIATAVTVPLVVIIGLLLGEAGSGSGGPSSSATSPAVLPAVTVTPPPSSASTQGPCTKVLEQLPQRLDGLAPRVVRSNPGSPFVVGWGNPVIVLRCGVARPERLSVGNADQDLEANGVLFVPDRGSSATVFTVIDRAVYLDVTVPTSYPQPPLGAIADAIAKALPAVCQAQPLPGQKPVPDTDLCTHRK
jgi:hypothetical protein